MFSFKARFAAFIFSSAVAVAAAEPADRPAAKTDRGKPESHFADRHAFILAHRSPDTKLLLLGASVIERWQTVGADSYGADWGKYHVDDLGVSGDKTQHILWRIDHGELDGMDPAVVLINTGNNNVDGDTDEAVVAGVKAVVAAVHEKLPRTRVLMMALFPRGADPENPKVAAERARIKRINVEVMKLDDGDRTRVVDIGDKFLDPDGVIRYGMMNDGIHPTAKGYKIWATAVGPVVEKMTAAR